jgi:PPM family protein phosphatase
MKSSQSATSSLLKWSGCTDRGKVRPNNEDAFLALRFNGTEVLRLRKTGEASTGETDFAFAVSDGMGGALAG